MLHTTQLLLTRLARPILRAFPNATRMWTRDHLRKWAVDRELVTTTRGGFRMKANPRDYASYGIYFYGEYDPRMTDVVKRLVQPGQVAFDVGTDRGWFTLLLADCVGAQGQVHAFEPFPANVTRLLSNLALNDLKNVQMVQAAVSDAAGTAHFRVPSDQINPDLDFLEHCSGVGYLSDQSDESTIEVRTTDLDTYCEQNGVETVHFIKLDIEGAEVAALRGARRVIERCRPMLAIEYNRETLRRAGATLDDLDALLDQLGYDRTTYKDGFRPVDLSLCEGKPDEYAVFNVYCFHRDTKRPAA